MAPRTSKKKQSSRSSPVTHRYNLRPRIKAKDSTKSTYISVNSELPSCARRKKIVPTKAQSASSSLSCIICLDTQEESIEKAMSCGHSFHENCISMWLRNKNTCPVCRAIIGPTPPSPPERVETDHVFLNTFVAIFMMGFLDLD